VLFRTPFPPPPPPPPLLSLSCPCDLGISDFRTRRRMYKNGVRASREGRLKAHPRMQALRYAHYSSITVFTFVCACVCVNVCVFVRVCVHMRLPLLISRVSTPSLSTPSSPRSLEGCESVLEIIPIFKFAMHRDFPPPQPPPPPPPTLPLL
jgi:hypothetical protein